MKQYDLEDLILSCILTKPELINEIYIDLNCFSNETNKKMISFLKKIYEKYKAFDIGLIVNEFRDEESKVKFLDWYTEIDTLMARPSSFYEYQQKLLDSNKDSRIKESINKYTGSVITLEELIDNINAINNDAMIIKQENKVTPEEMLSMVRNKEKIITFDRFKELNNRLKIKKKTINVIAARPSEGKSALSLNLFCDLAKTYKCLYFNMEMTEEEVYERMLGIESNMTISDISFPKSDFQEQRCIETANRIYNMKYEIINGSKNIKSIRSKIIKEQKNEHVMVFIDYVGYIVGKAGQSDKERIGEAVRELNNITKDYDCTIFLVAQINRNGSDVPTMQDLKDSGELEQSADTIILIHDDQKANNVDEKEIGLLIPKCRGGKRNVRIPVIFNKPKQRFEVKKEYY